MNERLSYQDESMLPLEKRNTIWFVSDFEQKMNLVDPYQDMDRLSPDKLVAAIVHCFPDNRLEILLGKKQASGYSLEDHEKILEEFEIRYEDGIDYKSILFEKEKMRYLVTDNALVKNPCFVDVPARYKIDRTYAVPGDFTSLSDILISNDWRAGIAQKYRWTNAELLRFTMVGELPEWKPPRYK